jgi:hypothetical protein
VNIITGRAVNQTARPGFIFLYIVVHGKVLWYNRVMKKSQFYQFKNDIIQYRKRGRTYGEIQKLIGEKIPKSTLSCWCKDILLIPEYKIRIEKTMRKNIKRGQAIALIVTREKRKKYLKSVDDRISHLEKVSQNKDVAKISLAMLYLGEGSKAKKSSLMFGNSDPKIINLFLHLMRSCYNIDENKFRCTLQCRADQDIKKLERFWSSVTNIPLNKFYTARIDARSIGKKSKKPDYKGVCRIDYFSADLAIELKKVADLICKMGL